MWYLDDANSFLLHIEVVDDDTDEEIESEERTEDDEEDEVEVHEVTSVFFWLLTNLRRHSVQLRLNDHLCKLV